LEALLAKHIAQAATQAHYCTDFEMKKYARVERAKNMRYNKIHQESEDAQRRIKKLKRRLDHMAPGADKDAAAEVLTEAEARGEEAYARQEQAEIERESEEAEGVQLIRYGEKDEGKEEEEEEYLPWHGYIYLFITTIICCGWTEPYLRPVGHWDDSFAAKTRGPLFGNFEGSRWIALNFAQIELMCRMIEAICISCLVLWYPTEAVGVCALQAFFLCFGNFFVQPCSSPWDHYLMGAVMFQEGMWYSLVGLYGSDAPSWVVMILNWSNMSSTMTLVLIALEPLLEALTLTLTPRL